MKKELSYLLLTGAVLALLGIGFVNVQAQNSETGEYPSIIQKLAEKFNLNIDEVKAVFDQNRKERWQEIQVNAQKKFEDMLDKLVVAGKITNEQKEAILAEKAEINAKREELNTLSQAERKEAMKNLNDELRKWAEQNGIDQKILFGFGGISFGSLGREGFCGGHFGPRPDGFGSEAGK